MYTHAREMTDIKSNIESIKKRIEAACRKANRDPNEVMLLAATKDVPADLIEAAIESGISSIGENRVQEAERKIIALKQKYAQITWHMIGHLQTNKVKRAVEIFDIIESVDSERLADEIDKQNKPVEILVEVNVSGESQKYGISGVEVEDLVRHVSGLSNLKVSGLMTVPPFSDDPEIARPYFRKLRAIGEKIKGLDLPNVDIKYLSMGMTDDFEVAVEEGSNIVRVGRGIFGIEH
jgi:pyridoxal phosphate enzyme (YggS family)